MRQNEIARLIDRKAKRAEHQRAVEAKRECVDRAFVREAAEYDVDDVRDARLRAVIAQRMLQISKR